MKQVAHSLNNRLSQIGLSCAGTGNGGAVVAALREPGRGGTAVPAQATALLATEAVPGSRVWAGRGRQRQAGWGEEAISLGSPAHLKDCTSGGSLQLWPRSLCTSLAAALIILSACSSLLCSARSTCEAKQTRVGHGRESSAL